MRAGARLHAFEHGDIERVVHAAASGGSLDLLLGIGGAPEGVLEAAIVRAHGGVMQAPFAPQSPARGGARGCRGTRSGQRVFGLAGALRRARALVVIAPVTACALGPAASELVDVAPGPLVADLVRRRVTHPVVTLR